jgi:hypothetical protein
MLQESWWLADGYARVAAYLERTGAPITDLCLR